MSRVIPTVQIQERLEADALLEGLVLREDFARGSAYINVISQIVAATGTYYLDIPDVVMTADNNVLAQSIVGTGFYADEVYTLNADINTIGQTVDATGLSAVPTYTLTASNNILTQSVDSDVSFDNIAFTLSADNNIIGQNIDSDGLATVPIFTMDSDNNVIAQTVSAAGTFVEDSGVVATGGTSVVDREVDGQMYRFHYFDGSDTFEVTTGGDVDVFMVAGGGGSSNNTYSAGHGGSGGLINQTVISVTPNSYSIVIGGGGAAVGTNSSATNNGGNTTALGLTALGGGGGGNSFYIHGKDGGSGGSSRSTANANRGLGLQPGSTDGGFGNHAGHRLSGYNDVAGSGGAGSAGGNVQPNVDGEAGAGINSLTFDGLSSLYGRGNASTFGGSGTHVPAVNRGSGGRAHVSGTGSSGSSGRVIIRYPI